MSAVGCQFRVAGLTVSSDGGADLHVSDFAADLARGDGAQHFDLLRADAQPVVDMAQGIGVLTGSIHYPNNTLDLTAEGTSDWITIGYMNQYDIEHKSTGNSQISVSASGDLDTYSGFYMQMSWEDGTPTMSVSNEDRGIVPTAAGQTFTFYAPADTTKRTLNIYIGSNGTCTFSAHLSDGSAADFKPAAFSAADEMVGTLTYAAATSGQTLKVTWGGGTSAYPLFEAATLAVIH